jgi:hypothetical protein
LEHELAQLEPLAVDGNFQQEWRAVKAENKRALTGLIKERTIEILLRKCIPDLAAAEIKSEQTHSYVIEIPGVLSNEQWLQKSAMDM